MEKDMTKGSPLPVILQFTLPLIIGNIFQPKLFITASLTGTFSSTLATSFELISLH